MERGKTIRRVKLRKLVGWDRDSLIGKAKAICTSKAKEGINSLLPITIRQVFIHFRESWAPSCIKVTWEDKSHNSERPPLPSSSPSFVRWAWCHMAWNIPLVIWGQLSWAVSPPSFLCTPSPLTGEAVREAEKALALCKHSSAITKTSLCYQSTLFPAEIQNIAPY